jgi:hypothetical protein
MPSRTNCDAEFQTDPLARRDFVALMIALTRNMRRRHFSRPCGSAPGKPLQERAPQRLVFVGDHSAVQAVA